MAFTPQEEALLRKTLDEGRVRAVLDRYFQCVDAGRWELLESIFTADATFEFTFSPTEKKTVSGGKAIAEYFKERNKIFKVKTHFVGHAYIEIKGDVATADTYCISNVVLGERIAIRGLRYADTLVRGSDGEWRFSTRLHRGLWQHYAAFLEPEVPRT